MKFLFSLILSLAIFFGNANSSLAREFDLEWQFSCGQIFEINGEPGTRYKISAPSKNALTVLSQENGNLEVRFNVAGDFYICARTPDGKELFYHLMVDIGQINESLIEQHHENKNFAQEILQLVNNERAQYGLAPLRLSHDLMTAAAIRAEEIEQNYSHTRPNGSDCFTVLRSIGRTAGENIAAGQQSAIEVMRAWMNSDGHRANILNPAFHELGVGYYFKYGSENGFYWAQIFRG